MKKKMSNPKPKRSSLALQKETLHRLDNPQLQAAVGGVRIWKPVGLADDTTPVYGWSDDTSG